MHDDVVVIGAGPAGLYAALRMAEEGLDVRVLEEHAGIGSPTHCTGVVSAETNSLYKIPDEIVLNRPSACLVVSPGGRRVECQDPGEEIAVLDRAAFDQALAASAQEGGGGGSHGLPGRACRDSRGVRRSRDQPDRAGARPDARARVWRHVPLSCAAPVPAAIAHFAHRAD